MIDVFGLFSINALYPILVLFILLIAAFAMILNSNKKLKDLTRRYELFMGGRDAKTMEEVITGKLNEIEDIKVKEFKNSTDIAEIFERAILSNVNNETLNFSTNKGITVNELFLMMRKIYRYEKAPIFLPEREGEIRDSILSNGKVMRLFGYDKFETLSEGLECLRNL